MTTDRWETVQSLFWTASEMDGPARSRWLAQACDGDVSLRDEVLALLEADRHSGETFIGGAVAAAAHTLAAPPEPSRSGETVGPYRLLRELGHGGMGTVYLAERVDGQYASTVAIKFVRGALADSGLARRMRAERQILADLTHPNIAWLLDGGAAGDGTPYLVMEYVDGEAIDAWCDARGIGLNGRLALFRQVCFAVQHAHQALIVHRDIKPSNILVTAGGTPKLVDFGIAKLLQQEGPEATGTLRLMTPAYAAPEQVHGGRITVATDVYALGGVLYRLLTGRTPLELTGVPAGEMIRRIEQDVPPPPSTAARGAAASWRRRLRGDLDTIVLKALRKEPGRRYATVEQLVGDLRRHEAGLPVQARADSWSYRGGKFLRRHRAAVAALVAVAVLTAGYTMQLTRERDRARVEAAKSEQIASFLQNLFEVSDPLRSRTDTVTARELLDQGARRITTDLSGQPAVQADLMQIMGTVYYQLAMYDQARDLSAAALAVRRRLEGERSEDVVHSEFELAHALEKLGDPSTESHYRTGLRIERTLHHGDHEHVVLGLAELASFLQNESSQPDEAESLFREALAMRQRLGDNPGSLAMLSDGLASTLEDKGDYAGAAALFARSVALVRAQAPVDSAVLSIAIHNQALALTSLGRVDEAISLERQALAISVSFYGTDHPVVSRIRSGLGIALKSAGDFAGAVEQYREVLAVDSSHLGPDHPDVGSDYGLLGNALVSEGKLPEGEAALREALRIRRAALGSDHPYVAISLNELAGAYLAEGRLNEAEDYFRRALALRRRVHPPGHPYIAYSLVGLARTFIAEHRSLDAIPLLNEADTIRRAALPEGHPLRHEVDSLLAVAGGKDRR